MKKTGSLGLFCMSAILGVLLAGAQAALGEEVHTLPEATDTNLASASGTNAPPGSALLAEMEPNSAFTELVHLVQAGVEPSVILAYIDNTLRLFNLDADDIIYLADLGAPAEIIEAAMEHDRQLIQKGISPEAAPTKEAPEDIEEQPPEVTTDYFYDILAPYGIWVNIEGYGRCWRPTVVIHNAGWQPYCDNGRWIYTDHGWYWRSGYSWGRTTFHYGRWFRHSQYGWCWWPDTIWAPSWVCWRYDRNYCGWAPLPPHAVYRPGIGFVYRGSTVTAGFNFGLNASAFTFVAIRNFYDPKPWRHRIGGREAERIHGRTTAFHKIKYDRKNRRVINSGIPPRDITTLTRQEIRPVSIRHAEGRDTRGKQHARVYRGEPAQTVNRPNHASFQKTPPRPVQQPERGSVPSKKWTGERNGTRKPAPQPPKLQRKQLPRAVPQPQAGKPAVTPQKDRPNSPVRRPEQKNRFNPPPKVEQEQKASPPSSPPLPSKGKKKARGKNPDQWEKGAVPQSGR